MLENGPGYGFGLSGVEGILLPHYPLQFRKLSHHLGDQVGFAQVSGPLDVLPGWRI
jgi:hypothetical protein